MDKTQAIERVEDWARRLKTLVNLVNSWYERLPKVGYREFLEGSILQVEEEMLATFEIPPRMQCLIARFCMGGIV